jgi:hypothetical protein
MAIIQGTPGATLVDTLRPGGSEQIVSGTQASPTEITTLAPHGLTTGDRIFFTASTTANVALTAVPQQVVTVTSTTKFTVPVNDTTAGATAGAYDYSILSIPTTPGAAPLINVGREHGLRIGDTVTIVAAGSTPDLTGAQVVTAIDDPRSFRVLTSAAPTTVAGSTTAAHYSKTIFYSDVFQHSGAGPGAITLTSVAGTAPVTNLVDMQASIDGVNWFNVIYTALTTPQTAIAGTQLTIASATTTQYLFPSAMAPASGGQVWRFFRLKFTSSTNVLMTANIYVGKVNAF